MSYTQARSTVLLATHCICCGLPLRDPKSLEAGMGPICRDRCGYSSAAHTEADRVECSKLIHIAARTDIAVSYIYALAHQMQQLGFTETADKVRERFAPALKLEQERHQARMASLSQPSTTTIKPPQTFCQAGCPKGGPWACHSGQPCERES
jgi:hypothetical protein